MKPDMRVQLAGIELVNPIIAASGTFGYGPEFEEIVSLRRIGGLVTKGISRKPMTGNQSPRLIETAAGMINAIGLQNIGVERFINDKLPPLRNYPSCAVIVTARLGTAVRSKQRWNRRSRPGEVTTDPSRIVTPRVAPNTTPRRSAARGDSRTAPARATV